jgi:hypothetical protein
MGALSSRFSQEAPAGARPRSASVRITDLTRNSRRHIIEGAIAQRYSAEIQVRASAAWPVPKTRISPGTRNLRRFTASRIQSTSVTTATREMSETDSEISSRTKTAPAIGALKPVAKPAPAPAAIKTLQSCQLRRKSLPTTWAIVEPICTLGPSRPSASPEPIAKTPPKNFTNSRRGGGGGSSSFRTSSSCGIPLPAA